jgi:hypothetical protein
MKKALTAAKTAVVALLAFFLFMGFHGIELGSAEKTERRELVKTIFGRPDSSALETRLQLLRQVSSVLSAIAWAEADASCSPFHFSLGEYSAAVARFGSEISAPSRLFAVDLFRSVDAGQTTLTMQTLTQRRAVAGFNYRRTIPIIFHRASRSARMAARMDSRLTFTGSNRKPSHVRMGFIKGTSFSTNGMTRTLPPGWREASKAARGGGNNSAEQIRPFLPATNFTMGLSHKSEPFQEQSQAAEIDTGMCPDSTVI